MFQYEIRIRRSIEIPWVWETTAKVKEANRESP